MSDDLKVPAGMKRWDGGDCAPMDWNGGPVLLATGSVIDSPYTWASHYSEGYLAPSRVVAYTPVKGLTTNETLLDDDLAARMVALVRRIADIHVSDETHGPVWCAISLEADAIVTLLPEPVDADLVEAREICARVAMQLMTEDEPERWAADYREGAYDRDPEVEHVLSVLRTRALERDSREG